MKKIAALLLVPALLTCVHSPLQAPALSGSSAGTAAVSPAGSLMHEDSTSSYALDRIDQRSAETDGRYRHFHTGKGVTVYVFDGGIVPDHPELAGRVRLGFGNTTPICNPHGTAVASAIAGTTLGVAPDAQIVDLRIINCKTDLGSYDVTKSAAEWALRDHRSRPGPAIANWSFILKDAQGHEKNFEALVDSLYKAGIAVVVSAGNVDRDACDVPPGNAAHAIMVGSTSLAQDSIGPKDVRTPGTAYGDCITLYAPGDSVLEANISSSTLWQGTSMSAGYVSGAAALYLETHPNATPDQVRDYLVRTATFETIAQSKASGRQRMLYVGPGDKLGDTAVFIASKGKWQRIH